MGKNPAVMKQQQQFLKTLPWTTSLIFIILRKAGLSNKTENDSSILSLSGFA